MSTTVKYDDFKFHATSAETRIIYASDFSVDVDGWIEKSLGDLYVTHDGNLLMEPNSTAEGVHYGRRAAGFITVGKKYKLTGEGYIKAGAPNVDNIRFYDGVDYHIGDFAGTADGLAKGSWHYFEAEFTAKTDFISFYMHKDGAAGSGTQFSANLTGDLIYLKNIIVTEITDGFPTPYVSRIQTPITYGDRWGQQTSYNLNGQITGSDFDDLIDKQSAMLSGFSRDFKTLDITEDTDIYTSDFSASLDGWGARDDNLSYGQTVGGVTDALKVNGSTNDAGHDGYSCTGSTTSCLEIGKKYRITGKFYIGTGGGNYHGMMIYVGPGASSYVGPWHDTYSSYISIDLGTWVDFDIDVVANSNHIYFYPLAAYSSGPPTNQFVASAADSFLIKDIVVTDLDGLSVAGFPAKNCKVDSVSFGGNKYTNILDYSVGIRSFDETLFSGTFGVTEPRDSIQINEIPDGTINLSHLISAKGFPANGNSSIENAKNFVHLNTGWKGHLNPFFISYENFDPILISKTENINRMVGSYGVSETYTLSKTGDNVLMSGHSIDISSGLGGDFMTVNLNVSYKGDLGADIDEIRGKIPSVTSDAYHKIATGLSEITDLNTGAVTFNVQENPGGGLITINSVFDNNKLFIGSNAYFDYEISHSTNELTSTTSVSINGAILARGNRKEKLKEAENFLENTVYSQTSSDCHHEAKYACYLYGMANDEYYNAFGTNIYTSDFSSDVDGWAQNNGAPGSPEHITNYGGETNVLRSVGNTTDAGHDTHRQYMFTLGKRYKISGKFYIDSNCTTYKGLSIYMGPQSSYEGQKFHLTKTSSPWTPITIATWVDFEFEAVAAHENLYFYPVDAGGLAGFVATTADEWGLKDVVVTEIPYFLGAYPSACNMQKNREDGSIMLSASFNDSYKPSENVKQSNWNISVKPPLRKYIPTSDVLTYPKHIFWNSDVITRSSINVSVKANGFDSINKSYGKSVVDNFVTDIYNTYVEPNSDIVEAQDNLSFNEKDLSYATQKQWGFHDPNDWVKVPMIPKP